MAGRAEKDVKENDARTTKRSHDPLAEKAPLKGVESIVAVASTKGGVGKSTVAVNLALALRDRGKRTGLMDADIFGPSIPTMLGVQGTPGIVDGDLIAPIEVMGLQMMSIGLLIPSDQPVIWRGPRVFGAVRQFLKGVKWNELDYLIVDLPPGTGDAPLTLAQQVPLSGVLMVTTPQEVALADVRRGIQMFRSVDVPILGVVENMSYFLCPDNDKAYDIFGSGGGERIAEEFHLPFLGKIPIDPLVREGGDTGVPAVENSVCAARAVFLELAGKTDEMVSKQALTTAKQ